MNNVPDFIIKSTLACALGINIILLPFLVHALINEQFLLALGISFIELGCWVNVWHGIKKVYCLRLNSYFISPIGMIAITYAFFTLGSAASYWPFVLLISNYFVLPLKRAYIFNIISLLIFIPSSWYVLPPESAAHFIAVLLIISLFISFSMCEIEKSHALLKEKATIDPLTGLFNRLLLKSYLQQTIAQSKRSNMPAALIAIDIDHFKLINDSYGHDKGDEVLEKLALLIKQRVRSSDRAFRMGGEEFLICLHNTNKQNSIDFSESLRHQIEQSQLIPDHPVTISLGVSILQKGMSINSWMRSSDKKLYRAKEEGRNRVII